MTSHEIDIDAVVVGERQRHDYPDIDKLASSIEQFGLIQPIVLDESNNLIAGGRRLAAVKQLGWQKVPAVVLAQLDEVERAEMELEENVQRSDLTWQERCCAIAAIHRRRSHEAALDSEKWSFARTGELLNMTQSNVWYALRVADLLNAKDEAILKCTNMWEAMQVLVDRKAKEAEKLIVASHVSAPTLQLETTRVVDPRTDVPEPLRKSNVQIYCDDMRHWLPSLARESVDHIYTDPPYAIDMDNLEQTNVGMDVGLVRESHDVVENKQLLEELFRLAVPALKPTGFMVLWCDQDHWQWLRQLAEAAGLRVKRWPIIRVKTHACMNSQAYKNFTKNVEIAMLCAMPKATLAETRSGCVWSGATDKQLYDVTNPFWKPLALHKWLLAAIAGRGSTICDPFAGCGSVPLAALQTGYNVIACEKDETHFVQMKRLLGL